MLRLQAPVERVDPERAARAALALSRALGDSKVDATREGRRAFSRDESEARGELPDVVVHATSADDVATALRVASLHEVPVTPRAGGTGRTGGAVPVAGGVVLATHGMRGIVEIDRDDLVAVVEPGVVLEELWAAVEREGLFYGPDPNSSASCCLGGNIAENAGGPRAFKYGVTRDWVLGLDVVTVDGARLTTGRRTAKGVTGYDLTALLVGSEGTLAVTTRATLRLVRRPPEVSTLLALFEDVHAAGRAVLAVLRSGAVPRCVELLDRQTLDAVRGAGNPIDARAGAMLLLEADGDAQHVEREQERIGGAAADAGALDVLVAQDPAKRERLWAARRQMSPAVRRLARHKLSEDVVVPRSRVPRLLDEVDRLRELHGVGMLTYGHAGDGNLHTNFLWDTDDEVPRVEAAILGLFRAVVALGGTLSGEHGVGVLKAPYLGLEQAQPLIDAQLRVKRAFDPRGLLNPGKIFWPASHRAC
ncbi:MAG: FAD-binding protein [Polyangiaceae bacterium]|nr:FAD-binding protein [Polyangiaceae bacterium]